jgi:hypothetical protein
MDTKTAVVEKKSTLLEAEQLLRAPAPAPLVPFPIDVRVPDPASRQTPAVGQRTTRPDGRLHGLGQTKYIDDFYVPGMLFCKIKRAGVACARIISVDTKEAEAMPGVVAVITGKDIPVNTFGPSLKDQPVLADEPVFHAGDGVAAVAAVSEQIAADAIREDQGRIRRAAAGARPARVVEAGDRRRACAEREYLRHKLIKKGDIEKGFAESYRIFEASFRTQMVEHVPARAALVAGAVGCERPRDDSTRRWGVSRWAALTSPRTLGIPMSRIRIIATVVGGNFGGKNEITTEPVVALLSKKTGRPVKCTFTRPEEFYASTTRHPIIMDYKTGRHEGRTDPRAQDSPGARRRRLLLLERDDARQGVHPVRRPVRDREPGRGSVRRLHEQDDDRRDARIRRAAGLLRLRVAHGRHRQGSRHRSVGDQAAQCAERRVVQPNEPDAA